MEYLTGLESLYLNTASTTITTTEDVESQIKETIDEKDNLIRRQLKEIMDLKRELDIVVSERDSLLCEVNKLKFELEVAGLKKVRDELRR
ncbi:hypothetical protein J437_LFUL009473 [Ladona fulva]|uniref:Uncharacterized protein n=1 Tax=Ladona fulva TaxID=123851 RepID=A0A8K0KS29_LADFU|nr:hypothetical protein J437_LFUL009473 [Ladona fulva]